MSTPVYVDCELNVQSVLGAPVSITGITKANPGVVSATAHGLSDGDLVLLQVPAWPELRDRVVRVDNSTADAFELEGIDTTDFPGDFAAGTFQEITFGARCNAIQEVAFTGGEATPITWNTIHTRRTFSRPGFEAPIRGEFTSLRDVEDPGLIELNRAHRSTPSDRAIEMIFDDGSKTYCYGSINAPMTLGGSSGAPVTTPISIDVQGIFTDYAS